MVRTGKVVSVQGEQLEVCFERPEACAHCGACTGQKHHTLVSLRGDAPMGSIVDVEMPDKQVLKASMLAYVVPLLLLLLGLWLGSLLFRSELWGALCGILLMALSWVILRWTERRMQQKRIWQPHIVAVHEEGE